MKELQITSVNRLDVTLDQEECGVLERCAEILHEMANYAFDEGVNTLICGDVEYDASMWLKEVSNALEHFSNIETVTITE